MRVRTLWKIGARRAPMLIYVDRYKTSEIIRVGDIQQPGDRVISNQRKLEIARNWLMNR